MLLLVLPFLVCTFIALIAIRAFYKAFGKNGGSQRIFDMKLPNRRGREQEDPESVVHADRQLHHCQCHQKRYP